MVLSAAVEGKNRPVATNFQFLKILCSSGTTLLQRSCVSEVLLVGACLPQTLLIIRALRHEWNGVSCLHNFTEELSNRQEVQ